MLHWIYYTKDIGELVACHSLSLTTVREDGVGVHRRSEDVVAKRSTEHGSGDEVCLDEQDQHEHRKETCRRERGGKGGTHVIGHKDQHEEERDEHRRSVNRRSEDSRGLRNRDPSYHTIVFVFSNGSSI
jgi:hypothetical protein